jgi:2-iminobutanoate/2-iminopropanoate deaminase
MPKVIVKTDKAPKAIGPYSQAVKSDEKTLIYTAGQISMDPKNNELVSGGIGRETRQVLENLKAILESAGSGLDKVIKTTVFISSMDDFAVMNEVYEQYFKEDPPARTTVEVSRLPKGVKVEIETVAYV